MASKFSRRRSPRWRILLRIMGQKKSVRDVTIRQVGVITGGAPIADMVKIPDVEAET